jgi:hypothetical protein
MSTITIANLSPRDVERFLFALQDAARHLDVLAQLQATVGTLAMQNRSEQTEEARVTLAYYTKMLLEQQDRINR